MADTGRERSRASTAAPTKPSFYLVELEGRQTSKTKIPMHGLPNRPDSVYPNRMDKANLWDTYDGPIQDPDRLHSVFYVSQTGTDVVGTIKGALDITHASFLVTDSLEKTVTAATTGVIWDLQRGSGDELFVRENEFSFVKEGKVSKYEYQGATDYYTWVIDKLAWDAMLVYNEQGYKATVSDCQKYARDMIGFIVTHADGTGSNKGMGWLASKFVDTFMPKAKAT